MLTSIKKKFLIKRFQGPAPPCTYGVYFVQDLPLFVRHAQLLRGLDGSPQLAGPHLQVGQVVLLNKAMQRPRKLTETKTQRATLAVQAEDACVCLR